VTRSIEKFAAAMISHTSISEVAFAHDKNYHSQGQAKICVPTSKRWKNLKEECIRISKHNKITGLRFKTEQLICYERLPVDEHLKKSDLKKCTSCKETYHVLCISNEPNCKQANGHVFLAIKM
jgi:hypothetical protein